MKAADAKAPKFDSKWWEQNKAKVVYADGKLKQALAAFETQIASFRRSVASGKTRKSELGVTKAKLEAVAAQAKAKASDSKLGALQKETKEALVNYEKISLQAVKDLGAVEKLP